MLETPSALTLQTLLATHSNTAAIKSGVLESPLVNFVFADVKVANRAFKPLVREQKFDLGELAIVTYLQAKAFGKPYVLMPAVIVARGQHHTIFYNPDRGHLAPGDLNRVQWITFEEPHVAEYSDPPWVQRAPEGEQLLQMLLDGEIDAAIFGSEKPEGNLKPLIPDAEVAAQHWADRHGGVPINHMMVVRESITRSRPDVVREVYRLLCESERAGAGANTSANNGSALRFGIEAVRKSLETIIDYSERQGLIPRRFTVDELFNDVTRSLG